MFIIGEATIEDQIARERFACDVTACKGACCTLPGGRGALLEDHEVDEVLRVYPFVMQYLSEYHRQVIERYGMVEGTPGSYATMCVDDRDCVFVYYEQNVARCAIERAFHEGKTQWRKPLSCHLFPIRVSSNGAQQVRYEKIAECRTAQERGRNLDVPLYVFLKEALVRKFGIEWYNAFLEECERRDSLCSSSSI